MTLTVAVVITITNEAVVAFIAEYPKMYTNAGTARIAPPVPISPRAEPMTAPTITANAGITLVIVADNLSAFQRLLVLRPLFEVEFPG